MPKALDNSDKVLSIKFSMVEIYKIISNENDQWSYVFEDDINILENITLNEIIQYENICFLSWMI
jgi:predicted extracellular nuclease